MKVAVLGCGPAGLMAAHGAKEAGARVAIISERRKSPLYGAQYLHRPIPNVTDRDNRITVDYLMRGSAESYRRKVYGPMWDGTVSPEDLEEQHEAWDIRETYERLWSMYSEFIMDMHLDPAGMKQFCESDEFDLVVNTVPKVKLCGAGHQFGFTTVWAAGDAPELGIDIGSVYRCTPNTVICNGDDGPAWYRMSNIYGHTTVEWPTNNRPPLPTASEVMKPTKNNCDCHPGVLHVGRYGSWEKGVLSHEAYFKTYAKVESGFDQPALF